MKPEYKSVTMLAADNPNLLTYLSQLENQIAELSKDRARLDWLESNQESVFSWTQDDPYGEPSRKLWQCQGAGLEKARDNIRAAIDAAAEAPNEKS